MNKAASYLLYSYTIQNLKLKENIFFKLVEFRTDGRERFGYYYWSFNLGSNLQLIGLDLFVFPRTINTLGGPRVRPF